VLKDLLVVGVMSEESLPLVRHCCAACKRE